MLSNEQLAAHFQAVDGVIHVQVEGDGHHYQLTLVSDVFVGLSRLARERWVYGQLGDYVTSGRLHALCMQTWTAIEWEKHHG